MLQLLVGSVRKRPFRLNVILFTMKCGTGFYDNNERKTFPKPCCGLQYQFKSVSALSGTCLQHGIIIVCLWQPAVSNE